MNKSCIEHYDDRDYIEEAGALEAPITSVVKTFSNVIQNQKLVDNYSCTWAAACGVIADVTGFAMSLSFREKVWDNQLKTGATEGYWDAISNWMKQAVKLFNKEFPELPYKLEYYRISDIRNPITLLRVLAISSIQTGYTGKLKADAQDNGIIDEVDNVDWGGHCIRIVKAWYEGLTLKIKYCDNYEGVNKYNVIEVADFLKNEDFFRGGYYVKKKFK